MSFFSRREFVRSFPLLSVAGLASCRSTDKTPPSRPLPPPSPDRPVLPGQPSRLPGNIRNSYTSCSVGGGYAAMTFDDGPHAQHTPRLLDMLRSWGIRATFYLIGRNVVTHPGLVRRMVAEGHEVANHSWSHPKLSGLSTEAVRSELRRTHEAIVRACGVAPLNYRPPYGAITALQKDWILREFGYPTILWSVDPNDWKDRNAGIVSQRIRSGARSGSIILAHDIHGTTVSAMPSTLPALRDRGLKFLTVSQLITMEALRSGSFAMAGSPAPRAFSPGAF